MADLCILKEKRRCRAHIDTGLAPYARDRHDGHGATNNQIRVAIGDPALRDYVYLFQERSRPESAGPLRVWYQSAAS